jgi:OOP family OmpA-OmpF porin
MIAWAAILMLTTPLLAQKHPGYGRNGWEFNASLGLMNDVPEFGPDGADDLIRRDAIIGIKAGYAFEMNLFIQGELQNSLLRLSGPSARNLNSWWYGGAVGYNIQLAKELQLFPVVGLGRVSWGVGGSLPDENQFTYNFGGGARFFLWHDLAIRGDLRYHVVPDALHATRELIAGGPVDETTMYLLEMSIGVSFFLGGPKDSDQDGVFDMYDECPDTPRGVVVDERGCPIDSDMDGVFDGLDRCPNTPRGAIVDAQGCPADEDLDMVLDGIDECPATPIGAIVDDRGCPRDSDGDGFLDGIDRCPDTPPGAEVDDRGCSEIQVGIIIEGLLILQNVYFDHDLATLRQESEAVLREVGLALVSVPDTRFEIRGYTDSLGTEDYNRELSQRRAETVRGFLVANFPIEPRRIEVVGYGEADPIATNDTPEGRQENRRVEFHSID